MVLRDSACGTRLTRASLLRAPKVLLHDHLDGGLRPSTIVELAATAGYRGLPTHDPDALAAFLRAGARRRSLELYLDMFRHTFGVMQTDGALYRVAAECAQDLADDGVVYAEVRFAPELHVAEGLSLDDVIRVVTTGFRDGGEGRGIRIGTLVTAMRTGSRSLEVAEAVLRNRDRGVVGFDIAGAEAGYPPSQHLAAFRLLQKARLPFTIHAGEAYGRPSIRDAVHTCGAHRIGHGIRIIDDVGDDGTLGPLASHVRDVGLPLEQCPTSNIHIGAVDSVTHHPVGRLLDLGLRVTVNTDNRLMSDTSLTKELDRCCMAFGWSWDEVRKLTINAIEAAFLPTDERREIVAGVIEPWFASRVG